MDRIGMRLPQRQYHPTAKNRLTSLWSSVTREPWPTDSGSKADMSAAATLAGAAPGLVPGWHSIDWRKVWYNVRRLQGAYREGSSGGQMGKKFAPVVYLLTHSFSGRALAILRVTTNAGASTPGVDGDVWNTPELKATPLSTNSVDTAINPSRCDGSTFRKAAIPPNFVLWASRL